MYSILSMLLLRSFFLQQKRNAPSIATIILSVLFCAAMGAAIEFLQPLLTMFRQFEWMDMIANATGALTGFVLFTAFLKRHWMGMQPAALQ